MSYQANVYHKRDFPVRLSWEKVVSFSRSLLKGETPRFSATFAHLSHVKGPLGVGAISHKIWDIIS